MKNMVRAEVLKLYVVMTPLHLKIIKHFQRVFVYMGYF